MNVLQRTRVNVDEASVVDLPAAHMHPNWLIGWRKGRADEFAPNRTCSGLRSAGDAISVALKQNEGSYKLMIERASTAKTGALPSALESLRNENPSGSSSTIGRRYTSSRSVNTCALRNTQTAQIDGLPAAT